MRATRGCRDVPAQSSGDAGAWAPARGWRRTSVCGVPVVAHRAEVGKSGGAGSFPRHLAPPAPDANFPRRTGPPPMVASLPILRVTKTVEHPARPIRGDYLAGASAVSSYVPASGCAIVSPAVSRELACATRGAGSAPTVSRRRWRRPPVRPQRAAAARWSTWSSRPARDRAAVVSGNRLSVPVIGAHRLRRRGGNDPGRQP